MEKPKPTKAAGRAGGGKGGAAGGSTSGAGPSGAKGGVSKQRAGGGGKAGAGGKAAAAAAGGGGTGTDGEIDTHTHAAVKEGMQPCTHSDGVMACMEPWRGTPHVAVQRAFDAMSSNQRTFPAHAPIRGLGFTPPPLPSGKIPHFPAPPFCAGPELVHLGSPMPPPPPTLFCPSLARVQGLTSSRSPSPPTRGCSTKTVSAGGGGGMLGGGGNDIVNTG